MIEISRSLAVNDTSGVPLDVEDVWAGLIEKAANPMPYVASITACTVVDRFEGGLVRDIVHVGQPVREVVTFHPRRLVHFTRTHGSARGTIDNEISEQDGTLTLTFRFRIVVDGIEPGSAEEDRVAESMESDYLDAVRTTLAAVRERVGRGASADEQEQPVDSPTFVRDVYARVDSFEPARFAEVFAPQGVLVFGNGDPMVGPAAVEAGCGAFFSTIAGISHRIAREWHQANTSVVEVDVTYDRSDGKQVSIPAISTISRDEHGLIDDYRVFFDLAPVYA